MNRDTGITGVTLRSVARDSDFYRAGLRRGDRVVSINGERVRSELDFYFSIAEERLAVRAVRGEECLTMEVDRRPGVESGVLLVESPVRRCANRCIFCFIDQMPGGLRGSLYVKDEDVRLSVLNGNYVTLSSFNKADLGDIARIGLSPLYVSVHATDPLVRRRMLRNGKAPDIMEQLRYLARRNIRLHAQIVVCPSWNDGTVLEKSLRDLLTLGERLRSVAVVPVGLTRFRSFHIPAVDPKTAADVCDMVVRLSDRAADRDGFRKLFLADEFFIKARLKIPGTAYYGDYPQIENGVGLVNQLMDGWRNDRKSFLKKNGFPRGAVPGRKLLVVTSVSAEPYIRRIARELVRLRTDMSIDTVAVRNRFFGETVTVAGLLTARDIVRTVRSRLRGSSYDAVVVPSVLFNFAGHTLDGFSLRRMEEGIGVRTRMITSMKEIADE